VKEVKNKTCVADKRTSYIQGAIAKLKDKNQVVRMRFYKEYVEKKKRKAIMLRKKN